MLVLNERPDGGPWAYGLTYEIHRTAPVGDLVVVLGRKVFNGRGTDWFIATYDRDGNARGGSTMSPDYHSISDLFDPRVKRERNERKEARHESV